MLLFRKIATGGKQTEENKIIPNVIIKNHFLKSWDYSVHAVWNLIFFVEYIMNVNDIQCFSSVTFWGNAFPYLDVLYSQSSVSDINSPDSFIFGGDKFK